MMPAIVELPRPVRAKHIVRFDRKTRLLHIVVMVTFLGLANFSDAPGEVGDDRLAKLFDGRPDLRLASDGIRRTGPGIWLPAWGYAWLADH